MMGAVFCLSEFENMPDRTLEQRMTEIEEGFANMQQEWLNIPDVIEARLRLTDSRVARLSTELKDLRSEVRSSIADLTAKVADLAGQVEGLPRVLAEMLAERDKQR
jgi:hypothetical protein